MPRSRVDHFHQRGLDGLFVLEQGVVMDAGGGVFDGAEHALVEVAELLSAKWGRAAGDSGDFDMSAGFEGSTCAWSLSMWATIFS